MEARSALALLLTVPVLAGCLAAPQPLGETASPPSGAALLARLSQPVYERIVHESLTAEGADDGTPLGVEVFRPEAPAGVRLPAILVNTPYMTDEDLTGQPYHQPLHDYFVPRGYAVVFADVRGTHNAGGCIPMTSMQQARDAAALVEWVAAQPWSNGKVGMFGISYDGETQQGAAILAPEHLVTIVPASSVSSGYLWYYQNGVPYRDGWMGNTFYAQIAAMPGHTPESLARYPERLPCNVEHHTSVLGPTHDGRMDAYYQERDLQPHVKDIKASVFLLHGLQDWNVKPINLLGWYNEIPSPKKGWFGQWAHTYPSREDLTLALHRWYDHWLLGIDTGILQEPEVQVQDSLGRWRNETSFPPREATPWELFLRRDALNRANRLSPEPPPGAEPPQSWTDAPQPARPALGLAPAPLPADPLPAPRLVYASEVLHEDVHVSGAPVVRAFVGVSEGSTHVAAHLYDVAPDGTMAWVNRGYMDTRFRNGLEAPEPMGPDEVAELRFTMNPQDTVFRAGHRIALALMSLDPTIEQDPSGSTVTLHHDAERPSGVTLPLVRPTAFHLVPEASVPWPAPPAR